ncbi:unnamed protein product [Clonostachys byssicola]|uniref:Secreted protein n=1 Tax=Clonostachys byssicola TaxID=160290 RepID=A0A9N9XUT1_9HYPO|nr:unnamed protein product [Clonostachys byssicola]
MRLVVLLTFSIQFCSKYENYCPVTGYRSSGTRRRADGSISRWWKKGTIRAKCSENFKSNMDGGGCSANFNVRPPLVFCSDRQGGNPAIRDQSTKSTKRKQPVKPKQPVRPASKKV